MQLSHYPLRDDARRFLSGDEPGYQILEFRQADPLERMLDDVARGLASFPQKWIAPTYFYDAVGSRLYERITALEEYYPTRVEAELIRRMGPEIAQRLDTRDIVELGSGSSTKTRALLDAMGADHRAVTYIPIDVSQSILRESASHLTKEYARLRVMGLVGQYEEALEALPPATNRLFLFLGGTIGNFAPRDQEVFVSRLARTMAPGNTLLLGFDRRAHDGKPEAIIHRAYNDSQGITAQFNLNLLARLNRDLGTDFALEKWRHRAIYNAHDHRIEMYLDSLEDQKVVFPSTGLTVRFDRGEALLTELSRKFDPMELASWFAERGFRQLSLWSDASRYFGLILLQRT